MKNLSQLRILIVALTSVLAFSSFSSSTARKGLVQYQAFIEMPSQ